MPIDFAVLPQDIAASIPEDVRSDASLSSFNNLGDLVRGHVDLVKKGSDWQSGLSEEHKAVVKAKDWKTPADVLNGYAGVEKYMGVDKIPAPMKGADGNFLPGEIERVMKALGAPDDFKKYEAGADFKLPEGMQLDEKYMEQFKAEAQKAGILPHQYQFMMKKLAETINQGQQHMTESATKEFNEASLALRTKYGVAYPEKQALANKMLNTFGGKNAAKVVAKYGNDPFITELLAEIGGKLSEDGINQVGITGQSMTPDVALGEIKKIEGNPDHPLHKADHPEHKYWLQRRDELYKMAYPQG